MSDEQGSTLAIERAIYVGNVFGSILYGVLVYMVFQTWYLMKGLKTESPAKKKFYICYGFIQLFLITVETCTNRITGQFMWIDHRDFPGGPFAYYLSITNAWYSVWDLVCGVISNAMNDGLLLYRCYVIWNGKRYIMVLPVLLYLAEIVTGILVPIETAIPNVTFFAKESTSFSIPWIAVTCTLHGILTLLIISRILYVSHKAKSTSSYTGVIAILVESAIPFSLVGIAFAICVGRNFTPSVTLAAIYGVMGAIAPQLIILRVAMGRAWTEKTVDELTMDIQFSDHKNTTRISSESGDVSDNIYIDRVA